MTPGECPKCGGPNLAGATYCQWCGSALVVPRPAPPLATLIFDDDDSVNPPDTEREESDDDEGGFGRHPPANLLARLLFAGFVGFLIIIAFASQNPATGPTFPYSGLPGGGSGGTTSVFITQILVTAPPSACGLNGADQGAQELINTDSFVLSWTLPASDAAVPCTVTNVSAETSGFSATANLPITVTSADIGTPLNVSFTTPQQYEGPLYLYFG